MQSECDCLIFFIVIVVLLHWKLSPFYSHSCWVESSANENICRRPATKRKKRGDEEETESENKRERARRRERDAGDRFLFVLWPCFCFPQPIKLTYCFVAHSTALDCIKTNKRFDNKSVYFKIFKLPNTIWHSFITAGARMLYKLTPHSDYLLNNHCRLGSINTQNEQR